MSECPKGTGNGYRFRQNRLKSKMKSRKSSKKNPYSDMLKMMK